MQKFWEKVEKTDTCWLWTAAKLPTGYGRFRKGYSHRVAYELLVGPIPPRMTIDHLCKVKNCCNPSHMEIVSRGENAIRGGGIEVASEHRRNQTHCIRGHEFTPENTRIKCNGCRQCATCYRMWYTVRNNRRDALRRTGENVGDHQPDPSAKRMFSSHTQV